MANQQIIGFHSGVVIQTRRSQFGLHFHLTLAGGTTVIGHANHKPAEKGAY
jgi:hypothetical protein